AAAAAGRLLGLDNDQLVSAFGLCCSEGSGTNHAMVDGSWNKPFHAGWASQSGVMSSFLGSAGFRASPSAFHGTHGWLTTFAPGLANCSSVVTADVGTKWVAEDISLKRYSCCHLIHASLEAV